MLRVALMVFSDRLRSHLLLLWRSLQDVGRCFAWEWRELCDASRAIAPSRRTKALCAFATLLLHAGIVAGLVLAVFARDAFERHPRALFSSSQLSVSFLDADGRLIGQRGLRHDASVPLAEMPPALLQAALATEDRRFYSHFGLDPVGIARAVAANHAAGEIAEGGSTITQQLAKGLFLTPDRTMMRKIREAFLAIRLEGTYSKDEILKLYLDRAYFGAGAFGVEAAAQTYFGKSIRQVNVAEAAMLVGLLKAPSRYAPHLRPDIASARMRVVLSNMVEAGALRAEDAARLGREPVAIVARREVAAPDYYLDYAFRELQRLRFSHGFADEAALIVRTGFEARAQDLAESSLEETLLTSSFESQNLQGALVVMKPDGRVVAMVGGRDYALSPFNRAVDAERQPGSAFKPFVYTAALLEGMTPESMMVDEEVRMGNWSPKNYGGGYVGAVTLQSAFARSINTVPVKLTEMVGRARVMEVARTMGLSASLPDTPSLPLGVGEVSLFDLTRSFAVFAHHGRKVVPSIALEVRKPDGEVLWLRERDLASTRQTLPAPVVADMNVMMVRAVAEGTARHAAIPGVRVGGKTGTTSAHKDAWFVGYTGHYVTGVWIGHDDARPMGEQLTGGTVPAQIFAKLMTPLHASLAPRPLVGLGYDWGVNGAEPSPVTRVSLFEPQQATAQRTRLSLDAALLLTAEVMRTAQDAPVVPAIAPVWQPRVPTLAQRPRFQVLN